MELFWIIAAYIVILTACFLLGEALQKRRILKKKETAASKQEAPLTENTPAE